MAWSCSAARDLPIEKRDGWDGAAAKAKIFEWAGFNGNSPDPSKAKRAFLFCDTSIENEKGAYRCPIAEPGDGGLKAISSGVIAAGNRLASTDVPANVKAEGQAIIDHYKQKADIGTPKKEGLVRPYTIDEKTGLAIVREMFVLPKIQVPPQNLEHLCEAMTSRDFPKLLYPHWTALRAERITRNRTYYMEDALRGDVNASTGIYSMLRPYPIPFIKDHATSGGPFGGSGSEIYGRVMQAFMSEDALDGAKAASVVLGVPDPYAIQKILEGSWRTVSMGSRTEEVYCSLCGHNLMEDPCDHDFDSEGFYAKIGPKNFRFMEISQVTVPSDPGAVIQSTNISPEEFKLFASDPNRETVYNLADPMRKNLLDQSESADYNTATALYESAQWLLDEFAPRRKTYFLLAESARDKEASMPMTPAPLSGATTAEWPDEAFGVLYTDATTQKIQRRFPITGEMTEAERAWVADRITTAKDLTPPQREALTSRLESGEGDPIVIEITAESYPHLLDLIDELRQESLAWETNKPAPATPTTDEALRAEVETLTASLQTERASRIALLARMVARQQHALDDPIAKTKTVDELVEFYTAQDANVVEAFYALLEPTFDQIHIDLDKVETVGNPVDVALTDGVTPPTGDTPVGTPITDHVLDELLSAFGPRGFSDANARASQDDDSLF